jgi:glutamate racemase
LPLGRYCVIINNIIKTKEGIPIMKIGIIDSGIGGLSVLHRARKMIPDGYFIYYADEKNVPYGEKSPEQIREFMDGILKFVIDKGADAIVIACNTATSALTMEYRANFGVPIVGMEPAVKKAVELYGNEKKDILVAATPVTINGKKLHELVDRVDKAHKVSLAELPGLVRFAENGEFYSDKVEEYIKNALSAHELCKYGTVVLGCTHFNYFKNVFKQIFGERVHFVDGNEGTVRQLIRVMPNNAEQTESGVEYYFSGEKPDEAGKRKIEECIKQLNAVYDIN